VCLSAISVVSTFPYRFSCVLPLSLCFLTTLDDPIQFSNDFRWFPLLPVLPSACLHAPGNLPVPSRALPAHVCCTPHPYSALDSQNLRACSCALFFLAPLVKPDQVSLGRHPFSRLQGTHPLHCPLCKVICRHAIVSQSVDLGQSKHNTNKGLQKCVSGGLPPRCPERMC